MKNKNPGIDRPEQGISNKKREKEYQEYVRGWVQYYRLARYERTSKKNR